MNRHAFSWWTLRNISKLKNLFWQKNNVKGYHGCKCMEATQSLISNERLLQSKITSFVDMFSKPNLTCFSVFKGLHLNLKDLSEAEIQGLNSLLQKRNEEYENIEGILLNVNDGNSISQQTISELSDKHLRLKPAMLLLKNIKECEAEIQQLEVLISELNRKESDIMKMALSDIEALKLDIESLYDEILYTIVPDEKMDDCNIIIELLSGVGGQEAMLFTKEIFDMYSKFINWKGWQHEVLLYDITEVGGLRKASININGKGAHKHFKFESGVHRVQRIPATEKGGRIHTSTITVSVLPKPEEIQVNINQKDLEIQTMRASGAGGQHVNTTDSAVRMKHIPTGVVVECQVNRSQIQNRKLALEILRARIYQKELDKQLKVHHDSKKLQVGSAARSEKIRTYNYAQDRITDHRLSKNVHNIAQFLNGQHQFENLTTLLNEESKRERLNEIIT